MAAMYFIAGVMHFVKPKMYMRVMPDYLPKHKQLVYLSGNAEMALALGLCISSLRDIAIYGIKSVLQEHCLRMTKRHVLWRIPMMEFKQRIVFLANLTYPLQSHKIINIIIAVKE